MSNVNREEMATGPASETMSADDIEREAAELESVYAELSMEVPEQCRRKTNLLLKLLLR